MVYAVFEFMVLSGIISLSGYMLWAKYVKKPKRFVLSARDQNTSFQKGCGTGCRACKGCFVGQNNQKKTFT